MLIKSSFKDYWDFAVFETDNRKVFVRKEEKVDYDFIKSHPEFEKIKLVSHKITGHETDIVFFGEVAFCGTLYPYLFDFTTGRYFYNYHELDKKYIDRLNKMAEKYRYKAYYVEDHFAIEGKNEYGSQRHPRTLKTDFNKKTNCPILISRIGTYGTTELVCNGKLADVKFGQVKKPSEAYTEIYNFIPYIEPKVPDSPLDMHRLEAKGFDKKTSFRPKMKSK